MNKLILIGILTILALGRNYPLFSQCDPKWGNDRVGTSSKTLCQIGCLVSSSAMALAGTVAKDQNPGTRNKWLTANNGYAGTQYIWSTVNKFGLNFQGFVANSQIKSNLDAGNIVIVNVNSGSHWVLAKGYSGNDILVNDPGYSKTSYPISGIVDGNSGVYKVSKMPAFLRNLYYSIDGFITKTFHLQREEISSPEPAVDTQLVSQQ